MLHPWPHLRRVLFVLGTVVAGGGLFAQEDPAPGSAEPPPAADAAPAAVTTPADDVPAPEGGGTPELDGDLRVYVIPVQGQIAPPSLFVLRRGLKDAIEKNARLVVLDMDTPGGRADVMLEMMEALERFEGTTATFVHDEAGSAGALIAAVTDDIYFSPTGVMGAAEIITGTGADVPEGLKRKMTSYINAKVRALSDSDPRRAEVLKAMTSPDFELKIDDTVLKEKGELLTLTAREAVATYGEPPRPLLATAVAASVDDLLAQRYPGQALLVTRLEITWSEAAAQWLTTLAPVLMGIGLLALFIEFKTPGFGVFGVAGGALLLLVFFGHYIAGLSGHEPALVFGLGLLLVLLELLVFPGTVVAGLAGVALMLGALLWSMADLWPNEPVEFSGDVFARPLMNLGLGLLVAVAGALALVRFLPRGWFWDRMILGSAIGGASAPAAGAAPAAASPLVGRRGIAVTALFPNGHVEIDGRRYEARLEIGSAEPGTAVVVRAQREFGLIVEVEEAT